MVSAPSKPTLAEFLLLPEVKPANEYIDGDIIPKPMPQGKHSVIQTELAAAINLAVKSTKIARALTELRCTFAGRSIVPDIAVFLWEHIPRDDRGEIANVFQAAPDWTIEILSPGQRQTRVTKNILYCLGYGTQMGWLVDPQEPAVLVYEPERPTYVCDDPEQTLPVPAFAQTLSLSVGTLFGWLRE